MGHPVLGFVSDFKEQRHRHGRCRGPEPSFVNSFSFPKQQVYQVDQVEQLDQVEQVDQGALVCE